MSPAIALVRATPEVCPLGGDVDAEHPVATRCDVLAGLEASPPRGVTPDGGPPLHRSNSGRGTVPPV